MIQITISEKDNPKVAGWLMDNNIEYSSVPVQEGKTANQVLYDNGIDTMRLDDNFNSNLFQAMEEYKTQSPVPVSVGYSLDDMEKMLGPVVHTTEQQDKGDGLD